MRRISEVAYKKDIIREVAQKTGYSERKVEMNYYALVDTIKKMSEEEDVATIYLPFIGSLYFKPLQFSHYIKNVKDTNKHPFPQMIPKMQRVMDQVRGMYHRHMKRTKIVNTHFTKGMNKKELEEHQNEAYNELKKGKDNS